ncbi:MAG: DUF1385 domain-containing protein [Chloroflexi bacterium]|nr:DUF1385 domain-containing protein [Chloroflexota bacterium]
MAKPFFYGGQAVLEGVMIRGRRAMVVAVRCPDGSIGLHREPLAPWAVGRFREIPLVRGVIVLAETLVLGTKALFYSANAALGEGEELKPVALWPMLVMALALVVGLFFVVPLFVVSQLDRHIASDVTSNLAEGGLRLAIFLLYLKAISLVPDIKRVFAYHGAEHKAVNAFEGGANLDVTEVQRYSTAHLRCGTAFLLIVLVVALLAFAFLGRPPLWLRLLSRVALLPVIAAVSYELLRLSASLGRQRLVRLIMAPGLLLQSLTTRQPDDAQVEVALRALRGALEADGLAPAGSQLPPDGLGVEAPGGQQDEGVKEEVGGLGGQALR